MNSTFASMMDSNQPRRPRHEDLVIDSVLTTQPELGPSVPDGGYGWVVFVATLFFQALVPSLIASFGVFLAFLKLEDLKKADINPSLWDNRLMYTPLLFIASWTFFDPTTRKLISASTWPRLVATSGTCLTCAGLLFLWMGMAGYGLSFYPLAGLVAEAMPRIGTYLETGRTRNAGRILAGVLSMTEYWCDKASHTFITNDPKEPND